MRAHRSLPTLICLLLSQSGCGAANDAGLTATSSADSTIPVQLSAAEVASAMTCGQGCPSFTFQSTLIGRVHVANLAYQKRVYAVYRVRGSNNALVQDWTTVDARWMSGDDWEFQSPAFTGTCPHYCNELLFEFAIGYEVAGQTYWDNNGGWNHLLAGDISPIPGDPGPSASLGAAHVMLSNSTWTASDDTWQGTIVVDNLAFQKNVDLVYSTDGWRTTTWTSARYREATDHSMEYWSFSVPMGTASSPVDFAIRYEVAGQTYWDNHLGVNYQTAAQ